MTHGRNLPLNTHKAQSFQQRESLLRLPAHIIAGRAVGTAPPSPRAALPPGLFVPLGHTHRATAPPPPGCQSILHPREYPSHGLAGGGGSCCSSAALFCFVLGVQLPKTQSHKTQFTVPTAFLASHCTGLQRELVVGCSR